MARDRHGCFSGSPFDTDQRILILEVNDGGGHQIFCD